jgi:sirohydrochlorin cobaltochelatase
MPENTSMHPTSAPNSSIHGNPPPRTDKDLFSHAALVLVGHGSTLNPDSSEPTHAHAAAIRRMGLFAEVACCFWKEQPSMREVLRMVESPEIYVVPNFISEGYFTRRVIPRELGLEGPLTRRDGRTIHYCGPVGSHPHITGVLLKRAAETGATPQSASLLIVGHGTSLNDNSARAAKDRVAAIRSLNLYAQVEAAYMEEPPLIADWHSLASQPTVIAVPFFISDGLHSYQDIPVLLGIHTETQPPASHSSAFHSNPHLLRGKTLFYSSAIGTEPSIANVILDQARDTALNPTPK